MLNGKTIFLKNTELLLIKRNIIIIKKDLPNKSYVTRNYEYAKQKTFLVKNFIMKIFVFK